MEPSEERQQAVDRLHILDALTTVLLRRTELLEIVGACATVDEAQRRLQSEWGMTEVQAMCALDLQVMRFTEQWRRRIADERDDLVQRIAELTA